jgi:leucyl aminopeptidase (aminopeptidase T)
VTAETSTSDLTRGVRNLLSCLGEVRGQTVALVTDPGTHEHVARTVRGQLEEAGALVEPVVMPPAPGTDCEPSAEIAAVLAAGQAVVELTTVSIRHSSARQKAQEAGVRYLYLGNPDPALFCGEGAIYADFPSQTAMVRALSDRVDAGSQMRLTSALGTDVTIDLAGRVGRALTGMANEPGQFGTPPCLEWGLVPARDGVNGRLVVDAYAVGLGLLSAPITVDIVHGRATTISGGPDSARLRDMLASAGNPHAYQVCEIGVGMNPNAQMIDDMISAEAVLGTAHIAVGTTPADPGVERVDAGMHIDLVFWRPTITIDDEVVMDEGRLVASAP